MTYVLDSTALIAFLYGETGADVVEAYLLDVNALCVAHVINLCEVYYHAYRLKGEQAAETAIATLAGIGVFPHSDLDEALWKQAGKIKGSYKLSLADAVGLALTLKVGGEFITSDHHELDPLAAAGVCPISFFR